VTGSVSAFVAGVDRLLAKGHGLFPASGGAGNVGTDPAPASPPAPAGGGQLGVGAAVAGDDYERSRSAVSSLGDDADQAAGDATAVGAQGRASSGAIRDTARTQAAAIDPATNQPAGVKLMVSTMDQRLADMQQELDTANAQNRLIAMRMRQVAAAYAGIGGTGMAGGSPLSAFGSGMSIPGGGGMGSLSGLAGLPGALMHPQASVGGRAADATGGAVSTAAQSPVAPPVPGGTKSAVRYIYQRARARGWSDYDATAIAAYSLGEDATEDPTVSGGAQGGPGAENTVIGNFQEKPQFARDAGLMPADRFTVEGNVEAYLRTLEKHRGEGDIFHQLFATSKGGPFFTGGYPRMRDLMAQARQYLGG